MIVVEGRADVVNLLHHGFKNAIALNGTSVPETIIELSHRKSVTVFVDGDRGGSLICKEIFEVADIDFVAKAPDGKEVEELTKKEIHKALRSKIPAEQAKYELAKDTERANSETRFSPRPQQQRMAGPPQQQPRQLPQPPQRFAPRPPIAAVRPVSASASPVEKKAFKDMLEKLIGTKGAFLLDPRLNVLGKVPVSELSSTIKSLHSGVYAVVFDGNVDKELMLVAETAKVSHVIGMSSNVPSQDARLSILTVATL